jgi:hypothetical protein
MPVVPDVIKVLIMVEAAVVEPAVLDLMELPPLVAMAV